MNAWMLNGSLLGEGVTDPRTFVSANIAVKVEQSVNASARRYVSANIGVKVTPSARLDGVFLVRAAINAKVGLVITTGTYYAKYVSAAMRVKTGADFTAVNHVSVSSSIRVKAGSSFEALRGRIVSANIAASVRVIANMIERGNDAPGERSFAVPFEVRSFEVL